MEWTAPKNLIQYKFVEFMNKCKKSEQDGQFIYNGFTFLLDQSTMKNRCQFIGP